MELRYPFLLFSCSVMSNFAIIWTVAHQASLSFTISRNLLKLMFIELMTLSNHLIPSLPSPPAFNHSKHQSLFQWVSSLHQMTKVLEFQLQHSLSNEHPGLISFRMDWLDLLAVQGTQESSPTPQFKSINSSVLSFLYSPTLTSVCDYWKTIALTRCTFVGKVMSLLFNMLSRLFITFLPRS